jgi:hypothetical protein
MLAATLSVISWNLPPGLHRSKLWRRLRGAFPETWRKRRSEGQDQAELSWGTWTIQLGLLAAIATYATYTLEQAESALYWLIVVAPLVALARLPGSPRLGPAGIYAWGLVLMTSVTHAIFFGDDRYHLTVSPLLCMLAAGAFRARASVQARPTS